MTEIPENEVTQADLYEWFNTQAELARLKSKEALLRSKVFKGFFKDPKEGTNKAPLGDGYELKATHVINRSVQKPVLTTLTETLRTAGIPVDDLIEWKPELKVGAYRKLSEEQLKLFDQCLVIKPGTPALEIVKPKKSGEPQPDGSPNAAQGD
jgi:hypothetical protein